MKIGPLEVRWHGRRALDREAIRLCEGDNRIRAIKMIREKTGMGLKEAAEYVNRLIPR